MTYLVEAPPRSYHTNTRHRPASRARQEVSFLLCPWSKGKRSRWRSALPLRGRGTSTLLRHPASCKPD